MATEAERIEELRKVLTEIRDKNPLDGYYLEGATNIPMGAYTAFAEQVKRAASQVLDGDDELRGAE